MQRKCVNTIGFLFKNTIVQNRYFLCFRDIILTTSISCHNFENESKKIIFTLRFDQQPAGGLTRLRHLCFVEAAASQSGNEDLPFQPDQRPGVDERQSAQAQAARGRSFCLQRNVEEEKHHFSRVR